MNTKKPQSLLKSVNKDCGFLFASSNYQCLLHFNDRQIVTAPFIKVT